MLGEELTEADLWVLIRLLGGDPTNRANPFPRGRLPQQGTAILPQDLRGPFVIHSAQQTPSHILSAPRVNQALYWGALSISQVTPQSCQLQYTHPRWGHQLPSLVSPAPSL